MTFINYASREINCKIVYYGPGLCGKTTNIQWIYEQANPEKRGKLVSLATETDRTLFFDFLPLDMGMVKGFKVRFHLYTVPGQVFTMPAASSSSGVAMASSSWPIASGPGWKPISNPSPTWPPTSRKTGSISVPFPTCFS